LVAFVGADEWSQRCARPCGSEWWWWGCVGAGWGCMLLGQRAGSSWGVLWGGGSGELPGWCAHSSTAAARPAGAGWWEWQGARALHFLKGGAGGVPEWVEATAVCGSCGPRRPCTPARRAYVGMLGALCPLPWPGLVWLVEGVRLSAVGCMGSLCLPATRVSQLSQVYSSGGCCYGCRDHVTMCRHRPAGQGRAPKG
jgi:hypothetical protein